MKFRWIALMLILALVPSLGLADLIKDETVYALLDTEGAVEQVLVVSRIETDDSGTYVDYGVYTDVTALTQDVVASMEHDTITWDLRAADEGFAYVGTMEGAELPYLITLAYALDGTAVAPAALIGQAGAVTITLTVAVNPNAQAIYARQLMAQVQIPLSRLHCADIDAPGATSMLVGDTQTLSYMVLPGQDATYTLTFSTLAFEMDSITIACMPISLGDMLGMDLGDVDTQTGELQSGAETLADGAAEIQQGVGALVDGLDQLATGAAPLTDGAQAMADGLTALSEGMGQLDAASLVLSESAPSLGQGVADYVQGVQALLDGAQALSTGMQAFDEAGLTLYENYVTLADGVQQALQSIAPLLAAFPEEQRTAMSAQLETLSEQLDAYAQGMYAYTTQSNQLAAGLQQMTQQAAPLAQSGEQLASGVSSAMDGVVQLSSGLSSVSSQFPALASGAASLADGQRQLAQALSEIHTAISDMPAQLAEFVDGQTQLADGIAQAVSLLSDWSGLLTQSGDALPSFASPDHATRTLQFVYQTPALTPTVEQEVSVEEEAAVGFWGRLKALFQ